MCVKRSVLLCIIAGENFLSSPPFFMLPKAEHRSILQLTLIYFNSNLLDHLLVMALISSSTNRG